MNVLIAQPPAKTRTLPLFCVVALSATAISWLVVLICYRIGFTNIWPLYPWISFGDFFDYYKRFHYLHSAEFFTVPGYPFTYQAPGVPLYGVMYLFGAWGGFFFYLAVVITAIFLGFTWLRKKLHGFEKTAVDAFCFTLLLTSYPLLFCIERGNLEVLLAIGLAFGTWAYWKERTWTAAILWGVCGSVKLYPLLLLAVFLSFRQYRQFFVSLLAAATTTFLSLLYIGPNLKEASAGISKTLGVFLNLYALKPDVFMSCDHSLFSLIKLFVRVPLQPLLTVYMVSLAAIMLVLYFVRIRKLPVAEQLLILTVASILLPPTSFDYTLLQLYAPFVILVLTGDKRVVLFGLLFARTDFLFYAGQGVGGQIKCVLLVALLIKFLLVDSGAAGEVRRDFSLVPNAARDFDISHWSREGQASILTPTKITSIGTGNRTAR